MAFLTDCELKQPFSSQAVCHSYEKANDNGVAVTVTQIPESATRGREERVQPSFRGSTRHGGGQGEHCHSYPQEPDIEKEGSRYGNSLQRPGHCGVHPLEALPPKVSTTPNIGLSSGNEATWKRIVHEGHFIFRPQHRASKRDGLHRGREETLA